MSIFKRLFSLIVVFGLIGLFGIAIPARAQTTQQQGSVGLQGTIPTDPPTTGATISFPGNGQTFTTNPINVSGICPADLLVKIFKNEVFAGSTYCINGSFSLEIDLFGGSNILVARVYDQLDQPGPDSNLVTVTFNDNTAEDGVQQLILTSNFALRGADPNAILTWPLAINGGIGPYAISVDWGDGNVEPSVVELAGNFNLSHIYLEPGTYRVIVKATDSRGKDAFIQLTAIANGPSSQDVSIDGNGSGGTQTGLKTQFIVWPVYVMLFFAISTFWVGRRYEIRRIRGKLARNERVKF